MTPAAPPAVAPINDAELEWLRIGDKLTVNRKTLDALIARLDAAEAELEVLAAVEDIELVDMKAERDRLAALNAELVEALTECECILADGDYGEDHSLRETLDKTRALLAKAHSEPAP